MKIRTWVLFIINVGLISNCSCQDTARIDALESKMADYESKMVDLESQVKELANRNPMRSCHEYINNSE